MATRQEITPNALFKHFKGGYYRIIGIALNTETEKEMVIYRPHNDTSLLYARPLEMFLSKVDKEKYPYITQEDRFEAIKE